MASSDCLKTGNANVIPKGKSQTIQHPDCFEQLLKSVHEWIGGFHGTQNTGRNIERLLVKIDIKLASYKPLEVE